ncbi:hypothetical protein [Methylobacterium sp. WL69]|uniref:hypothetical protein n=1 Tax=Methylobacterium sp. WL69 TaxID=2603893 RepID=UPI001FEDC9A8|nr:hypothetical protein [Methylobacterium sp. WL69]
MQHTPLAPTVAPTGDGPSAGHAALLRSAVARGIITDDQALALDRLAREDGAAPDEPRDDERLRFITGFADIFVTIGLVLFLGAATYFGLDHLGIAAGHAVVAVLAWGLAEFFTRARRMALPSIVLLLAFAHAGFSALAAILLGPTRHGGATVFDTLDVSPGAALPMAGAALGTVFLVAAHYRRFAVPITVAAGAASTAGLALALILAVAPGFAERFLAGLLFLAGLAVFALAMRFDLADPKRLTRRTDIAFWLHLLAAPLMVHPILSTLAGSGDGERGAMLAVLAIVLVLAFVALAIDRRALLVSGLVYAGIAFGALIRDAGFTGATVPASLLALGTFILALSAGWHPLRGRVLRTLPRPWAARLPHPIGA